MLIKRLTSGRRPTPVRPDIAILKDDLKKKKKKKKKGSKNGVKFSSSV